MEVKIEKSWKKHLSQEFEKDYFNELVSFVKDEYVNHKVYPKPKNIFRAFESTSFDEVKVVILGQDPYHGTGQANGLCFSVNEGINHPPSLKNIFKELKTDLDIENKADYSGDLVKWSSQGVFLLNATLTVRANQAGSHQHKGWEEFTDAVIKVLNEKKQNLVFLLWGRYAQEKGSIIDESKHLVLKAAHPSPFSAYNGFFGCKHFSKTNAYLKTKGIKEIDW